MELSELTARLEALNEHHHNLDFQWCIAELEKLHAELQPFGLYVMLVQSPYSQKYLTVYAVLSAKAEES